MKKNYIIGGIAVVAVALVGVAAYVYMMGPIKNGMWQERLFGQVGAEGKRISVEADIDTDYLASKGLTINPKVVNFQVEGKTVTPEFSLIENGHVRMVFNNGDFDNLKDFRGTIIVRDDTGKETALNGRFKRAEPDTTGLAPATPTK